MTDAIESAAQPTEDDQTAEAPDAPAVDDAPAADDAAATDAPADEAPAPAVPTPGRIPVPRPPARRAAVAPVAAAPAPSFGRVDDDGTVSVREGDDWRVVGQYPDGTPAEALAYFERKYADLAGEVTSSRRVTAAVAPPRPTSAAPPRPCANASSARPRSGTSPPS